MGNGKMNNQGMMLLLMMLLNGGFSGVSEGEDTSWLLLWLLLMSCGQGGLTATGGCNVCEA